MDMDGTLAVEPSHPPGRCALCQRILSSEIETGGDLEALSLLCGDCKFLFLEDSGTPIHDIQRGPPSTRLTRYNNSSESFENMLSQQFPDIINLATRIRPTVSEHRNQSVDSVQHTSLRTTPSESRRWRRVLSDTESDGFDSVYGESDIFSYAAYGGDSDASVDVDGFLDNDGFAHPDSGSVVDSDTDIDPMHAGLNQWHTDDDEEDDDEFEEVEADENTFGNLVGRVRLRRSLATNGRNLPVDWLSEIHSPEADGGAVHIRISERSRIHIPNLFGNLEDEETSRYMGNAGDYVDVRGFEELLERLAETDSSRRGAPPAAASFVKNLELVVVDEELDEGLVCVICKDSVCVGSVVNRLPCLHVYHPSCIMPWLNARNTCPLCRYELPTDDKDYERRRRSRSHGSGNQEMQDQGVNNEEDASSEEDEGSDMNTEGGGGGGGGGWWFVAAPIVSVVGFGIVLWLGGGVFDGSWAWGNITSQRDNRSRRWWCLL